MSVSTTLNKLGFGMPRHRSIRIMVLGQAGVGKSALVVRFITRRFIGEYDPSLEKVYTCHTLLDEEATSLEILDTAGQPHESECVTLEANIRWAEAFILMYSVTDKCSFDECNRLKFLINYNKRRMRLLGGNISKETQIDVPVVLVGNKIDLCGDRMISLEDGHRRSHEIGCQAFHEISVRESIDQVVAVFQDVCHFWKMISKWPRLKRSASDLPVSSPSSLVFSTPSLNSTNVCCYGNKDPHGVKHESDEIDSICEMSPFRSRASTDGHLLSRPRKHPNSSSTSTFRGISGICRRMSISMKGNVASY